LAIRNFLKNKASNTWPDGHYASGLATRVGRRLSSQQEEVPEDSGHEERLPVITFFLGILATLYHRCYYVSQYVKEKENSESLDVLFAKVKFDCHEYFQTSS
jgi:hypothetical protein